MDLDGFRQKRRTSTASGLEISRLPWRPRQSFCVNATGACGVASAAYWWSGVATCAVRGLHHGFVYFALSFLVGHTAFVTVLEFCLCAFLFLWAVRGCLDPLLIICSLPISAAPACFICYRTAAITGFPCCCCLLVPILSLRVWLQNLLTILILLRLL